MSVTLETIQEMWEKDAKIDRDNLHEESLNVPSLHAKYFELYNTIFLLRKQNNKERTSVTNDTNTLVGKQIPKYTRKTLLERR